MSVPTFPVGRYVGQSPHLLNFYSDVSTRFDNSWLSLLQPLTIPMRRMSIKFGESCSLPDILCILPDGGTTVDVRHVYSDDSMTIALVCILLIEY